MKNKKCTNIYLTRNLLLEATYRVGQKHETTYARCGGIFNNNFTANLPRNLPVKKIEDRLRFDRITAMSLWSYFFWPAL